MRKLAARKLNNYSHNVGDTLKCEDFTNSRDTYVVGRVTRVFSHDLDDAMCYEIKVTFVMTNGAPAPVSKNTMMIIRASLDQYEWDGRIQRVG